MTFQWCILLVQIKALRVTDESRTLSFVDGGEVPKSYDVPFTMYELCSTLVRCRDGAAGPDALSYLSFVIFIPQRWGFCLAFSTGFTRLNFFPIYNTSQLSFPFQNQARITLCIGINV